MPKRKLGLELSPRTIRLLREALEEDVGQEDVTTRCSLEPGLMAKARIVAKQEGVLCGLAVVRAVVHLAAPSATVVNHFYDGKWLEPGMVVSEWEGPAEGLLKAERLSLNMLGNLSGIATLTRRFVLAAERPDVCIRDTRKTTPLWRELEKYAVRVGYGTNHREGLHDMILIKDNHIDLAGGIDKAVERALRTRPEGMAIEVECRTLDEVRTALQYPVDALLLDNMDLQTMQEAVQLCGDRVRTEASGGVTLERIAQVAATGVTDISIGALTHSAPALDFSVRMERL